MNNFNKGAADEAPFTLNNKAEPSTAKARAEEIEKEFSQQPHKLISFNYSELIQKEIPTRKFILDPWIPEGGICQIFSKPGVGKTNLGLSIAITVASGSTLLGWTAPSPKNVLYLDGEMHEADLQKRIKELGKGLKAHPNLDLLRFVNGSWQQQGQLMPDIASREGQAMVEDSLGNSSFLIIDNLSTLTRSGKENEAEGWRPIQGWLLSLRWKGISTLIIHHARKGSNDEGLPVQRGTSAKEIILESSLALKTPKGHTPEEGCVFEGHFVKSRGFYGKDATPFEARVRHEDGAIVWEHRKLEKRTYDLVVDLYNEGITISSEIAKEIGVSRQAIEKHIKTAKMEGDIDIF